MTEEQLEKIREIRKMEYRRLDKNELSNLCDMILGVWELEEDDTIKEAIAEKFGEILDYIISRVPETAEH